jgi:rhodanese-related sulfurtransferase
MVNSDSFPIEVSVQDVEVQLKNDPSQVFLLDCREPDEFETAKISGAVLIPMSAWNEFESHRNELEGKRVVVYCHHGMRSRRVTNWLRENGFPQAQSMSGGINAWSLEIDTSVPLY